MTLEFLNENFKKGDPFPPRNDLNTLRVYNFQLCPYAERVLLVLEAKGIEYEAINVNLRDKPEWLLDKNPLGKVPVIEFSSDNKVLNESLVIADYLDELYPDVRPLRAKDPYERAKDRLFVDSFGEVSGSFGKLYHSKESLADIWNHIREALKKAETILSKRRTQKFLSGESAPGMVDYMIWPFIERIPAPIEILTDSDPNIYLEKELPTIYDYRNEMLKDSAVSKIVTDVPIFKEYIEHIRKRVAG